jgi:hypothetical protein
MITNVYKCVPRDILGTLRVDCVFMNHPKMFKHLTLATIAPGINISMNITQLVTNATPAVKLAMANMKLIVSPAPEEDTSGLNKPLLLIDFVSHVTGQPCSMAPQGTVWSDVVMA